jgi:hypothetical protein
MHIFRLAFLRIVDKHQVGQLKNTLILRAWERIYGSAVGRFQGKTHPLRILFQGKRWVTGCAF